MSHNFLLKGKGFYHLMVLVKGKGKVYIQAKWPSSPRFCGMKRLGVYLLSPGWVASPSQGYPQHLICWSPCIHLGGERTLWDLSFLSKNTIQYPPARAWVQTAQSRDECINREGTLHLHVHNESKEFKRIEKFLFHCSVISTNPCYMLWLIRYPNPSGLGYMNIR